MSARHVRFTGEGVPLVAVMVGTHRIDHFVCRKHKNQITFSIEQMEVLPLFGWL
jgi:hypothetical protein